MPFKTNQTFAIKTDDANNHIHVEISEKAGVQADNLSLATWGSSFILANILYRYKDQLPTSTSDSTKVVVRQHDQNTIPVLEIGAGTGLVGLSAALIWKRAVCFTDLKSILPGIRENIAINAQLLADAKVDVRCGTLDWRRYEKLHLESGDATSEEQTLDCATSKAQIIMAADTCYSEEHPELVTQTVAAWLAPGKESRVFITYAQRVAYLDQIRELWERMENAGLECIDEGREEGEERWDEQAPYEWCVWKWKDLRE